MRTRLHRLLVTAFILSVSLFLLAHRATATPLTPQPVGTLRSLETAEGEQGRTPPSPNGEGGWGGEVAPLLTLDPTALSVAHRLSPPQATTHTLTMSNTGDATLTFSAFEDGVGDRCDSPASITWLQLATPSSEIPPAQAITNRILISTDNMAEGVYTASLCFLSDSADAPLIVFPITLTLSTVVVPHLVISDTFVYTALAGSPVLASALTLINEGNGDLEYTLYEDGTPGTTACDAPTDIAWFDIVFGTGTLGAYASTDLWLYFDPTALPGGVYSATLCILSNDPTTPLLPLTYTFNVYTPTVAFTPDPFPEVFALSDSNFVQFITVTNTSIAAIELDFVEDASQSPDCQSPTPIDWVELNLAGQAGFRLEPGASETLVLFYDVLATTPARAPRQPADLYTANLCMFLFDNPVLFDQRELRLRVARPRAQVAPASLSYTALTTDPAATFTFTLTNSGNYTLTYDLNTHQLYFSETCYAYAPRIVVPWLTTTPATGALAPGAAEVITVTIQSNPTPTEERACLWVEYDNIERSNGWEVVRITRAITAAPPPPTATPTPVPTFAEWLYLPLIR